MPDGGAAGVKPAPVKFDGSTAGAPGIQVASLLAEALPPRLRFDAYRASVENLIDVTPFDARSAQAGSSLTIWRLGRLSFSQAAQCAQSLERAPGRNFAAGHGYVRLRLCTGGHTHLMIGDDIFAFAPGEIHIVDYSRPFREVSTAPYEQFGVMLPHAAIGYDPARHPQHMRIGLDTPVGRVLADTLLSYRDQLDRIGASEAPGLARGFCGLIGGLVFPGAAADAASAPVQAARRQAMRAFVDRNLCDPGIGFAAVARAFGASRATIFRDFAEDGGIDHYVTRRRLERAFVALADRPAERGAVQAVALSYGFTDLGHFSRLFRSRFGVAPSDVLTLGGVTGPRVLAGRALAPAIARTIDRMSRIITSNRQR